MKHQDSKTLQSNAAKIDSAPNASMQSIIQALEAAPRIAVPPDFTARVMQRLPARPRSSALLRARALSPRYGTRATLLAAAAFLLMLVLLPFYSGSPATQAGTAILLLADLYAIVLWLLVQRWRYR